MPLSPPDTVSEGEWASDETIARRLERLVSLEASTSALRHDLRGILAPALLVADRLLAHADPKIVRAGETVVKCVQRAEERLRETKEEPAS